MEVYKRFRKGYRGKFLIESRFYACHPSVALLYFIGIFTFVFIFQHPLFLITTTLGNLLLCRYYIDSIHMKSAARMGIILLVFTLVINPLINHRGETMLFYLLGNPVTLEAILYGGSAGLMIFNLIMLFLPLNILIDSERFLYLFGHICPKLAFITNMSLRYTNVLKSRGTDMADIQKTRNIYIDKGTIKERFQNGGKLLSSLVTSALEEGMLISEVLKSKEYGGKTRSRFVFYRLTRSDITLLAVMIILIFSSVILSTYGVGKFGYYPQITSLKLDYKTLAAYTIMIVYWGLLPLVEITK
ncbi:MAG: energy-coupling factor transporter transmembrane component T [Filifactoraceae bacterium]